MYTCGFWNQEIEEEIEYEKMFTNNITKQQKIRKKFFRNLENRVKHKNNCKRDKLG